LPGVGAGVESGHEGGGAEVGVVEDDRRRLAAELEEHLLERFGGGDHDLLAGGRGAGEGDQVHARVGGELCAHAVVRRRHDVRHSLGDFRFLGGDPGGGGG